MLDISELICHRGDRKLFGPLTLSLASGRVLSVEGPNGCGKTTLLRALCGLTTPDFGTISWQGQDIAEERERFAGQVAYIGHRNGLKEDLSPIENVQASLQIAGYAADSEAVRAALEAVGLSSSCCRLPTKFLSEGQKRRVALARLWCSDQPLWVLDEPFTALDAQSFKLLRDRLQQHVTQGGIVVVATHQDMGIDPQTIQQLRLGA